MQTAHLGGQATATSGPYRAAVADPEAVVAHHDLAALFHELASLLHRVVRFDCPSLFLHGAARSAPGRRQRPQGGASGVAPPVCSRLVSFRAIRNSIRIRALRRDALAAAAPARPVLLEGAGKGRSSGKGHGFILPGAMARGKQC